MHAAPRNNPRSFDFGVAVFGCFNRAFAVNRLTQRINNPPQQPFAHRHTHNFIGTFYDIAFLNGLIRAENNDTDVVFFEIKGHSLNAAFEFNQFI